MLPKKGRKLPVWTGVFGEHRAYALAIAELLRKEHGDSHRAIKQVMRQTDASERSVKHWFSGQHGPDAVYFLRLVVSSPVIKAFVLGLIEGPATQSPSGPVDRFALSAAREAYATGEKTTGKAATRGQGDGSKRDPKRDPINVPDLSELNERQRWFLALVEEGRRCGAKEIVAGWKVSLKTARRDISTLQQTQLLEYIGSRRRGRYRRLS